MRPVSSFGRLGRTVLLTCGAGTILVTIVLIGGAPIFVDRLVIETSAPVPASAIVCISGGLFWKQPTACRRLEPGLYRGPVAG